MQDTTQLLHSTQSTANTACSQEQYYSGIWNKVMHNQLRNLYTLLKTQVEGMKHYCMSVFNTLKMRRDGSAAKMLAALTEELCSIPSIYLEAHK